MPPNWPKNQKKIILAPLCVNTRSMNNHLEFRTLLGSSRKDIEVKCETRYSSFAPDFAVYQFVDYLLPQIFNFANFLLGTWIHVALKIVASSDEKLTVIDNPRIANRKVSVNDRKLVELDRNHVNKHIIEHQQKGWGIRDVHACLFLRSMVFWRPRLRLLEGIARNVGRQWILNKIMLISSSQPVAGNISLVSSFILIHADLPWIIVCPDVYDVIIIIIIIWFWWHCHRVAP